MNRRDDSISSQLSSVSRTIQYSCRDIAEEDDITCNGLYQSVASQPRIRDSSYSDRNSTYTAPFSESLHHLKQCEEVVKSNRVLRICVIVFLGLNIVIIIGVCAAASILVTMNRTIRMELQEVSDRSNSQYGCSTCNSLKQKFIKLKMAEIGEKLPNSDDCCFETAGETLTFIAESIASVVNKWVKHKPKIHAEIKRKPKGYKSKNMLWQLTPDNPSSDVTLFNSTYFIVPKTGYYFIYNKIQLRFLRGKYHNDTRHMMVTHDILRKGISEKSGEVIHNAVVSCPMPEAEHSSIIQSIFLLRENDAIYVAVSPHHCVDTRREEASYFGLFLVSL